MLKLDTVKIELSRLGFNYENNILPGHSVAKIKWVLPVGPVVLTKMNSSTSFLFGFTKDGVFIFPVSGDWHIDDAAFIPWEEITDFKMKKGLLENTMEIKTLQMKVSLKINKKVAGNPWVKSNVQYLEENNYFRY